MNKGSADESARLERKLKRRKGSRRKGGGPADRRNDPGGSIQDRSVKGSDADESASREPRAERRSGDRRKGDRRKTDRRQTMAGMWKSDEASPGDELAGLVKEIAATQGSGVKRRRTKLSRSGVALAVAVVLALLAAPVAWFFWPRTVEIPNGMVGRWTTTVPEYAAYFFVV